MIYGIQTLIDLKFIVKNPSAEVELRLYIQVYSNGKELLVGDAWSLSMISQLKYQTVNYNSFEPQKLGESVGCVL